MMAPERLEGEPVHHPQTPNDARSTTRIPTVRINLLGGFAVVVDDQTTPARGWSRRSASALVKILALATGHRLHREQVLDLLWPDEDPERSAPRLHKAAHFARRAAGRDEAVVLRDDVVWLFPGADIVVDTVEFERLARLAVQDDDADTAREALTWYGGELLPAERYEDWASDRRELLALRRLDVLRVAGEWRELTELDPTNEHAHLQLMRRQVGNGDAAAAIRQYEHLARVLDRELGVEPGEASRAARDEAMRRAEHVAATGDPNGLERLVTELAGIVHRQSALLVELSARCGCPPGTLSGAVGS
jgi:DNA-binding SARP family transcriptional activator